LPPPVAEFGDSLRDELRRGLVQLRTRLLHVLILVQMDKERLSALID
jgi:hypothetical protein